MIIFGGRSKDLDMVYLEDGVCSVCGAHGATLTISQPYFHIYFIPMFPVGKRMQAKCSACSHIYGAADFTPELQADADAARRRTRSAPVVFAGLAVIVAVIIWVAVDKQVTSYNSKEYLASPLRDDLIVLPVSPDPRFKYEIFRVDGVEHDSVFLSAGTMGYHEADDAEHAVKAGRLISPGYFDTTLAVSRAQFVAVAEKYKDDALVIRRH
jgi:hypothetical protein